MAKAKSTKKNGKETATPVTVEVSAAADPSPAPETKVATRNNRRPLTAPSPNLVPLSLDEEIRQLAYLFSERRGFEPGHETEDWLAAEHEVRARYHQPSA